MRWRKMALAGTMVLALSCPPTRAAVLPPDKTNVAGTIDYVFLVHGLDCMALSMSGLESELTRQGYRVINVCYPSSKLSVEDAAAKVLAPLIEQRATNKTAKIHFVTHSMGGLVVRQLLRERRPENLGRVVMLAPPNHGSELADKYKRNFLYRVFAGPAGQQLGTGANNLPEQLGPADFEVGIIAGDRSSHPLWSSWIPGPDDGKVSVASTKLDGMKDFLVVHHTHTWIMWKKDVFQAVSCFLQNGRFTPGEIIADRQGSPHQTGGTSHTAAAQPQPTVEASSF